jgi:hypothetical protein
LSDQIKIKSVSSLTTEYVNTIRFIVGKLAAKSAELRGELPNTADHHQLAGDVTRREQLREAFPQREIDTLVAKIPGNETTVGTTGDLTILAKQSDMQARCVRAYNLQYASRAARKLHSAYRLSRHSAPDGLWYGKVDNMLSLVQQNTTNE